ncbi:hypothetical protein [Vallitalea guaymasensis]|uniref:hypothetical protein n=1 Tax=Vallitalea guaymasensis TaxID=1185412 RepID=UPI000DE56542|nr:hypothetical protein [Vallitalea guaymasensis]
MKFGKIVKASILSLSLIGILSGPADVFAADNTIIPDYVLKKVEAEIEKNKQEIPKLRAWEEDSEGNIKEVTPLSKRNNNKAFMYSYFPNEDEYAYIYDTYIAYNPNKNWKYKSAGTCKVTNEYDKPVKASYTQSASSLTTWEVSGSISAKGEIGVDFLAKLELELGGSYSRSKAYSKGWSYSLSATVDPWEVAYITNYVVGGYTGGQIKYHKVHKQLGTVTSYYENAGGTAVSKNDTNVVITASQPILH